MTSELSAKQIRKRLEDLFEEFDPAQDDLDRFTFEHAIAHPQFVILLEGLMERRDRRNEEESWNEY